ncbi:MAG: MFS transporter [Herpetosiphonaceae bacterium]|nr:MFS transporter [Herpetosiphonaceae bacterium]
MVPSTTARSRYPALHHRNFTLIWAGLLVSNMGTWMQNVGQNWLIYKVTNNNPIYLGYLGLSFAIPMIVVPPVGGAIADRVNRVKLLYITQTGSLLLAVLLAVLTWSGTVQPLHILVITFAGSLLLAFDNPTRQALIPGLVPREDLMNAVSLNSATYTGAALIGPAIAGLLLNIVGAGWLFMINALSYLAVIGALFAMRNVPTNPPRNTSLANALFGGFRYVWQHKLLLGLLLLSITASLFGRSYQQLLPIFADDVWHTGPGGYGALLSAGGAGALIGAFIMSSIREIKRQGLVLLGSGLITCLALAAFALSPQFIPGLVLLAIVGIAVSVFGTMIATMLQLDVPSELRGRVLSLYAITLIGIPSLGSLGIAAVADGLSSDQMGTWARIFDWPLRLVGVQSLTEHLGKAAGGPRAITLSAILLTVVLVLSAPALRRVVMAPRQATGALR